MSSVRTHNSIHRHITIAPGDIRCIDFTSFDPVFTSGYLIRVYSNIATMQLYREIAIHEIAMQSKIVAELPLFTYVKEIIVCTCT